MSKLGRVRDRVWERDFFRVWGREGKESLPARGSRRDWPERKESRPMAGTEEERGVNRRRRRRRRGIRVLDMIRVRVFGAWIEE